jgi:hypothetical protein
MATACPRQNEARPKCAKCNLPHRTENCGVKCTFCTGLGHSEDKCWKTNKDGKSASGAANYLEVVLDDEAATEQRLIGYVEVRMHSPTLEFREEGLLSM